MLVRVKSQSPPWEVARLFIVTCHFAEGLDAKRIEPGTIRYKVWCSSNWDTALRSEQCRCRLDKTGVVLFFTVVSLSSRELGFYLSVRLRCWPVTSFCMQFENWLEYWVRERAPLPWYKGNKGKGNERGKLSKLRWTYTKVVLSFSLSVAQCFLSVFKLHTK